MTLDRSTLRGIAQMRDDVGVLSIYVNREPFARADRSPTPPWEIRLRQQLTDVRELLREHGPREHWRAVSDQLATLSPELAPLLDPTTFGQGRALFVGVASGETREVALQAPLTSRVVMEPRAFVRPLLEAWSASEPAGVVAVSADQVTLVDLRLDQAETVGAIPYLTEVPEQDELKGPPTSNPAQHQVQGATQRDLFGRREDVKLQRFLHGLGPQVAEHVITREWTYLVLTGEPRLVQALQDGLPPQLPTELLMLEHPVITMTAPELAELVAPELAQARHCRHHALAQQACDGARAGGTGACGVSDTLGALQAGRVSHLLLAIDQAWTGSRSPEDFLTAAGEVPPGGDPESLAAEPHLGERMIELAFDHAAEVTMLTESEAAPLAEGEGVGALLRW